MVNYVYMDHPYNVRPLKKTYNFSAKTLGVKDEEQYSGYGNSAMNQNISATRKTRYALPMLDWLLSAGEVCAGQRRRIEIIMILRPVWKFAFLLRLVLVARFVRQKSIEERSIRFSVYFMRSQMEFPGAAILIMNLINLRRCRNLKLNNYIYSGSLIEKQGFCIVNNICKKLCCIFRAHNIYNIINTLMEM